MLIISMLSGSLVEEWEFWILLSPKGLIKYWAPERVLANALFNIKFDINPL